MGKEYTDISEDLSSPRGKIDISASLKKQTQLKKRLICDFDIFSENTHLNQILKTTAMLLIHSENVRPEQKKALKKILLYFSEVDTINPHSISWSRIHYHRHNSTYKMLINICYLVVKGLLQTTRESRLRLATFFDDQRMHSLFEKFVLAYYKKHYPQFKAAPSQIDWNIDEGSEKKFLPAMKTDVTLQYQEKTLIIDTKYYSHTMQRNSTFDSRTIHSGNLYQIYTYVKNKDVKATGNVSGILLYAKTDEELTPNNDYIISGNKISVKVLDLNKDFADIKKQLDKLVEWLMLVAG